MGSLASQARARVSLDKGGSPQPASRYPHGETEPSNCFLPQPASPPGASPCRQEAGPARSHRLHPCGWPCPAPGSPRAAGTQGAPPGPTLGAAGSGPCAKSLCLKERMGLGRLPTETVRGEADRDVRGSRRFLRGPPGDSGSDHRSEGIADRRLRAGVTPDRGTDSPHPDRCPLLPASFRTPLSVCLSLSWLDLKHDVC